ncbi:hypothetical protein [Streptomyces sp. NPDC048338]|uniref:hypothetical protein n=1 Tax=Streptomyces sp. NPDC048338 TaxID=3365536 RepID=UPI003720DEA2
MTWPSWIDQKDYSETKKTAVGASSSVTAIKGDITLIKAELAGLAVFSLGASVIKFDYTWFKMDEKGVTINGRQRIGWPWADPAKSANLKAENRFRALEKKQGDLKAALARLDTARTDVSATRTAQSQAETDMENARRQYRSDRSAASLQAFFEAEKKFKQAKKLADKAKKELEKAEKEAKKLEERASKRFQDAKKFVAAEAEAKKKWENAGDKVLTEDLNRLRTAVGKVTLELNGQESTP